MNHLTDADLQAWIDDELDPGVRVQVADHLASCGDCRASLSELRAAADLFSEAIALHDEGFPSHSQHQRVRSPRGIRALPTWVGRAAAVTLLVGGAAAAAVVPGSPLRDLILGSDAVETVRAPESIAAGEDQMVAGASITVRPLEGRIRIRISEFPAGTQIHITLTEGELAVANLPQGEPNGRFVVAAGLLEVVGPGPNTVSQDEIGLVLQLPSRLQSGVVELNGVVGARVSGGRIVAERQVSRLGDKEVIIEVGE
jgi:hypothetical protein